MISRDVYGVHHVTRPGYGEPLPAKDEEIHTVDGKEDITRCLNCKIPPGYCEGQCNAGELPRVFKGRPEMAERKPEPKELTEFDLKTLELIHMEYCDKFIRHLLGISRDQLEKGKRRLERLGVW